MTKVPKEQIQGPSALSPGAPRPRKLKLRSSSCGDRLDEREIKKIILNKLRNEKEIDESSIIASEHVLGTTKIRADLSIWNGKMIGIEIKSRHDSLKKLIRQLSIYRKCFDKVILAVDFKHLSNAKNLLPLDVELWCVHEDRSVVVAQKATASPEYSEEVLPLLLNADALRRLTGVPLRQPHTRAELLKRARTKECKGVYEAVVLQFQKNFKETSHTFWEGIQNNSIEAKHISNLSPYMRDRLKAETNNVLEQEFWATWKVQAAAALKSFNQPKPSLAPQDPQIFFEDVNGY